MVISNFYRIDTPQLIPRNLAQVKNMLTPVPNLVQIHPQERGCEQMVKYNQNLFIDTFSKNSHFRPVGGFSL